MTLIAALKMENGFVCFLGVVNLKSLFNSNLKLTVDYSKKILAFVICIGNIFDYRGEVAGSSYCKFLLPS